MRNQNFKAIVNATVRVAGLLLFGGVAAFGQNATVSTPSNFGVVAIGASTTQSVTVSNASTATAPLTYTTSITGPNMGDFVTADPCLGSVAIGASCAISVTFAPTATPPGAESASLSIATNDPANLTLTVGLAGTGYEPTASPASLIFAHPAVGSTTSPAQAVTLTNTSVTPLTFSLTINNSAYSVVSVGTCPSPITLPSGSVTSCTVNLVFTPPAGDTAVETGTLGVKVKFGTVTVPVIGSSIALTETDTGTNAAGTTYSVVELTAASTSLTLPDGSTVPMWGYSCAELASTTCKPLNPKAGTGWSPVVITIPTGQDLNLELTNNLSFANGNTVPTSIMIVGQVGGGLGNTAQYVASPDHSNLGSSTVPWPTVGTNGPGFTPPMQGQRVQSFSTEVAAGTTARLLWKNPRPGTYLIESGTHPSIQGTMGLYGVLVVTTAPTADLTGKETAAGQAYPLDGTGKNPVKYDAEVPLLFGEIDPVQNNAVNAAVSTSGFTETAVWSGQPGGCGNPSSTTYQTCYPPAVNYTPLYYTINGVAFNKTSPLNSLFPTFPATLAPAPLSGTGSVLVRLVNAGSRMHVPSIVGSQTTGATGATNPTVTGFQLIAEDGNPLPGLPRVQSEVFMAAGKTYDVMINGPTCTAVAPTTCTPPALPVYDRELSLSGNAIARDAGMLAYIGVNGSGLPLASTGLGGAFAAAVANTDTYNSLIAGKTFTVSDPAKGVIANDVNIYGVQLITPATSGTVVLNSNGTFTYTPTGTATSDSFAYCGNGATSGVACTTVNLGAATIEASSGITCTPIPYTANTAKYLAIKTPGVLAGCKDAAGYPLTVNTSTVTPSTGLTLYPDANGGFTASVGAPGSYTFSFQAKNSQGTLSSAATVTLTFPTGSGLIVNVLDGYDKTIQITDYRWIIEEDRTFFIDPKCATNPVPVGCPTITQTGTSVPLTFGTNFHTSYMPYVAQGCTGTLSCEGGQTVLNQPVVCDVGNGACRPDPTSSGMTAVDPKNVVLDPTKRYYISVLPGDAANPFGAGYGGAPDCSTPGHCGHGMGGAPLSPGQSSVTILTQPSPYPPGKLSVMVFEDDYPLNGEIDSGGGVDVLAVNEPGLGGFQIHLWDAMGGNGDFTGQMSYDMFNQPLTNSLAGSIDPATGNDACPVSVNSRIGTIPGPVPDPANPGQFLPIPDPTQTGITGMIVTCPKYESDGITLSPLAGQAVVNNLMAGRWGVIAMPGADRIARGEEWLQTNTLDGQKAHDVFTRIGEPSYFQEFGPAGYHVTIGFANPAIINARLPGVCAGTDAGLPGQSGCTNTIIGKVVGERLSRTPDERLYGSDTHDAFYWTQSYASIGDPDGEDFAFVKCDADGNFKFTGIPNGTWRVTTFDQWNDQLVDGLSTPVATNGKTVNLGNIAATQWQTNLYTKTFIDDGKTGVPVPNQAGIPFANVAVRLRDGSLANLQLSDFNGTANFNETFPLFSWYVVETDVTRYKNTGTHVVYDAGGPADGSASCGQTVSGYPNCGTSTAYNFLVNTNEAVPVPNNLRVPGSVYCDKADCSTFSMLTGPATGGPSGPGGSTGRIDSPWLGGMEGWQGFPGQNNYLEFGKAPYYPGENGGIKGHVIYASTRPFDDPQMLVQTQWEPLVPHVTINLYQEGTAPDGTQSLALVDTTQTSSFDDWAQGFHLAADGVTKIPNMNCPGQTTSDLFLFTLSNQPQYLDFYNNVMHGTSGSTTPLPNNAQFKCYDGMHNWNQIQPAPYDGMYLFPSVTSSDPTSGKPLTTNCTICTLPNNLDPVPTTGDGADPLRAGLPMLPPGKYVVEVVLPPGFELVKEEDKNILIGDNYIAPVTQEFGGLGNIFIIPDQASVASAYNANNAQNPTQSFGAQPNNGIVPAFVPEPTWPCVGETRIVPDYISLYPATHQVSPFAGATRNLCDRKEVTLGDQMGAIAKFYVYTSTHIASKFTGGITDDFTSEFDPFSPQFGEKFAPPNLPIAVRDWSGTEISRVYADHWGSYDGMTYSTWEVNPPNPTGYAPTMMVFCMNDPGPIPGAGGTMITDPAFNPSYSQFCYELPFMPGTTQYLDTPVVPTSAFSEGYNHPDCAYPDATPAIAQVNGDGVGPYVSAAGRTLTITALGDQLVNNYGYAGPSATNVPFNQKTITRHYDFGSTPGTVSIGGVPVPASNVVWSKLQITLKVPSGVPQCAVQQQAIYGGSVALCGQLAITNANGNQAVDTVTVTIGGKPPTYVASTSTIQSAIDGAMPGDLIIVPPGTYNELLIMWKPVRLQGVGAATSILNANTHPAGKLDPWRAKVSCLFGLATNGQPFQASNPFDPTKAYTCGSTGLTNWYGYNGVFNNPQVDRVPLEGILGWDTTVNGNLAQLLQEPTLLGAYEGAGITVLSKGVNVPSNATTSYYGSGAESVFPTGTTVLTALSCLDSTNPHPSNFQCNPSSIDGLSVTDSSQGGGGIFVHAWAHNLQIANNRVYNNIGTLSGGINIGQGESPDAYLNGTVADSDPGSCNSGAGLPVDTQLPFCFDLNVNVHNNSVTQNTSIGDELFSGTPAGAGGVSMCTGADYYKFQYNWICGNMSTGDGGGFAHVGFIWNGDIEKNTIIFNQSLNPTISTNGGGIVIMGAAPDGFTTGGIECGSTVSDADCTPGLPDGTGPGLIINANLIMGNAAESGSGGGIRLQSVNGTEVSNFPHNPARWNSVMITNNIIANNVAGWDGAGVSLQDAFDVDLINNTIVSNDTTASAGVLFNTLGAPLASAPGATNQTTSATTSAPQPAGLVSMGNSPNLTAAIAGLAITCPARHPNCQSISDPYLASDLFWQNRSYYIGVPNNVSATYQQNIITLYNSFTATQAPSQPQADATVSNGTGVIITGGTGACTAASYWDIGVRGDTGPGNHASGFTIVPHYSVLTNASENTKGMNTLLANPNVLSQYCNGSRTPPEFGSMGWQVPPGISDATVPNPIFSLSPAATVDEGNNWVNMQWGPLSLVNPVSNTILGNYALASSSPAIDYVPVSSTPGVLAPTTDFFGNPRPDPSNAFAFDVGAVEFQGVRAAATLTAINPPGGFRGNAVPVTLTGANLAGATAVSVTGGGITISNFTVVNNTTVTATFTITAGAGLTSRNVTVTTPLGITNSEPFTVAAPTLFSITPNSGVLATAVPVTITGAGLTGATAVNAPGSPNITVTNFVAVSSTTVTATLHIAAAAGLGAHNITVTTPGGTAGPVTFTLFAPPVPTLTSIAPNSGIRGNTVPVTLTGTNLTGATLNVSGTGITVSGLTVVNNTTVTASFAVSATAALGADNITVTTLGGTSNSVPFSVQGATLTSIAPVSATHPTTGSLNVPVTLTGTSLTGATGLTGLGTGVSVVTGTFTAVNSTTVTATLHILSSATVGARNIAVSTPIGNSTTVPFTVN